MKNLTKILAFIIAVSFMGCNSHTKKHASVTLSQIQIKKYENIFKDLKGHLVKDSAEKLWNYPIYGPLIFVNPKTRVVIANEPDNKGLLVKEGAVYAGILPKSVLIANTEDEWAGKRWAMVKLPLPKDFHAALNLMIHESFHRIQPAVGFADLSMMQNKQLNELNGRIFFRLELDALQKALMTEDPAERQRHIRDALLFRYYRYKLYPGAKESENSLELKEGLAEYTGSILSGRTNEALKEYYIKYLRNYNKNYPYLNSFTNNFAYVTIPAYGYLMRMKDKYWNRGITEKTNLTNFMTTFFHVTIPSDLKDTINNIEKGYDYDKISSYEIKRSETLQKLTDYCEARFIKNPTLTISLINYKFSYNPNDIIPFKNFGNVYAIIRINDSWGMLNVEKGGALLSKKMNQVTVPAPTEITDSIIKGNGWNLKLNKGWKAVRKGKNYTLKMK